MAAVARQQAYPHQAGGGGHPGDSDHIASLQDFKQLALLGEGAYSAVYKVLRLADREVYALKKVKLPSLSDKEKQNALNEIRLLASINHENVIGYKEAFFDDKTRCLCIVQECADAGDLLQVINRCKQDRTYMPEPDVWRYLSGMCKGLKALHDLRILHRDMKCANIFLGKAPDGTIAKLGDFNVSKVAKRGLCMTQTGTPYYASPEVWKDMPYDAKSDMWSLGCVLYEMVGLRPPFRAEDMEGLYRKVVRGQYPRIPQHYSQDLAEVISVLLQVHPRHRPSVEQLLQMPAMLRNAPGLAQQDSLAPRHASDLLSTIKLPKNAIDLSQCLPKARYQTPLKLETIQSGRSARPGDDLMRSSSETPVLDRRSSDSPSPKARRPRDRGAGSLSPVSSLEAPINHAAAVVAQESRRPPLQAPSPSDHGGGGGGGGSRLTPSTPQGGLGRPPLQPQTQAQPQPQPHYQPHTPQPQPQQQPKEQKYQPYQPSPPQTLPPQPQPQQQQAIPHTPVSAAPPQREVDSLDAYLQERQTEERRPVEVRPMPVQQQPQTQLPQPPANLQGSNQPSYAATPSINPRYQQPQQPQGHYVPSAAAPPSLAPSSQGRPPRAALEPRRAMAMYARQQYESPQPQGGAMPGTPDPSRKPPNSGGNVGTPLRRHRSLISRLF